MDRTLKQEILRVLRLSPGIFLKGIFEDFTLPADSTKIFALAVEIEVDVDFYPHNIPLRVCFDKFYPFHKPKYYLISPDFLGQIPHVDHAGCICFSQDEESFWDFDRPGDVVTESFATVLKTLKKGIEKQNLADFATEFPSYWCQTKLSQDLVWSFLEPKAKVKKVQISRLSIRGKETPQILFFDNLNETKRYLMSMFNTKDSKLLAPFEAGIYVPLTRLHTIIPPKPQTTWRVEEVKTLFQQGLSKENFKQLKRIIHSKKHPTKFLCAVLQDNVGKAFFVVEFDWLWPNSSQVINYLVERYDRSFVFPRGGANIDFNSKNVAVVGCGSLGGSIALELVRLGIGNLDLVDSDKLSIENSYRHVVGCGRYNQNSKTYALKTHILECWPYTQVETFEDRVEELLANKPDVFDSCDLIIVATANPAINLWLNREVRKRNPGKPMIFTWVEPYGIGGHAIASNNGASPGCYECLYTDASGIRANWASFFKDGQSFAKTDCGCGSAYVPYQFTDVHETALLAVRLASSILDGKEKGNPCLSWKKQDIRSVPEGYEYSARFLNLLNEELYQGRYEYRQVSCKACGGVKQ